CWTPRAATPTSSAPCTSASSAAPWRNSAAGPSPPRCCRSLSRARAGYTCPPTPAGTFAPNDQVANPACRVRVSHLIVRRPHSETRSGDPVAPRLSGNQPDRRDCDDQVTSSRSAGSNSAAAILLQRADLCNQDLVEAG